MPDRKSCGWMFLKSASGPSDTPGVSRPFVRSVSETLTVAAGREPPSGVWMSDVSVIAAFFDSGLRNAGTPLEIASVPDNAMAPDENARSSKKIETLPSMAPFLVSSLSDSSFGGSGFSPPK